MIGEEGVEQMARALAAAAALNPQRATVFWDNLSAPERDRYRDQAQPIVTPPADTKEP